MKMKKPSSSIDPSLNAMGNCVLGSCSDTLLFVAAVHSGSHAEIKYIFLHFFKLTRQSTTVCSQVVTADKSILRE